MAKRDVVETLRQMREFAQEACDLARNGDREKLDIAETQSAWRN